MAECRSDEDVGIGFSQHFDGLEDARQQKKVLYALPEVLPPTLCAVLGGADGRVEVATLRDA